MLLFRFEVSYDVEASSALEAAQAVWSLLTEGAPESPVVDVTLLDDNFEPVGDPLSVDLGEV